jgi:hypothetical protein
MSVWMSFARVIADQSSDPHTPRQWGLTALNRRDPGTGARVGGIARSGSFIPGPRGSHSYAGTAGSPTPMTFRRRDRAVNANSFISRLE